MSAGRIVTFLIATAVLSLPAMAQDRVRLDDLDADRLNPRQIKIEFEYDGGACEQVEEARLGDIVDGTLSVTFPTSSTAEVCTMQLVEIEVKEAVPADTSVTRVEVTLLAPDGSVLATDSTRVDRD